MARDGGGLGKNRNEGSEQPQERSPLKMGTGLPESQIFNKPALNVFIQGVYTLAAERCE